MHAFGGSVVVAAAGDILKIHVHTDTPEAVFSYAARWGRVETTKADDMRAQHRRLAHPERRAVAIVTDSSADLPDPVLDRHHIALVPLQVVFGDETFRDRVELKPEEFYRRLREAAGPAHHVPADARGLRPGASATPGRKRTRWSRSCSRSDLSGTFASAQAAVRAGGVSGVHLVDSRSGLTGARDAGAPGRRAGGVGLERRGDIAAELERVRGQSGMLLTVDRYDNLLRSGRVSRGKAWLAGMLDVKPILSLDAVGTGHSSRPGPGPGECGAAGAGRCWTSVSPRARRWYDSGWRMPRPLRWPSGCGTRSWRPTSRGTASSRWPPACSAPMWGPAPGRSFTRSRTAPPSGRPRRGPKERRE